MFCCQCEQTNRATHGCHEPKGVCGKDENTADLQDLLIRGVQGVAHYAARLRQQGQPQTEAGHFMLYALFTTLTNVNFNASRIAALVREAVDWRDRLRGLAGDDAGGNSVILHWQPAPDLTGLLAQARDAALDAKAGELGEDVIGLRALVLYGIKGAAAYAHHALMLGYSREALLAEFEQALDFLAGEPTDADALLAWSLRVGRLSHDVMALLDEANTGSFGQQQPHEVSLTPRPGKAILVSGHDLHDLALLLEQTRDSGINVYTHGEMLPAHAYPKLHGHSHFAGHYGTAWQNQHDEFRRFPGAILVTSNCLIEPDSSYKARLFTSGPVGWPGVRHLGDGNFRPLIDAARALPGFSGEQPARRSLTVGFGRHAVLGVADKVVDAVKSGAIRHFFLIGGCDGAAPGRNYFTELAEGTPQDTVVLTLGCGKFRFNDRDFGDIGGIPRLLDMGQCNDAYSAIQVATALSRAFDCSVNELPLSLMVSWFEQKAVAVLLCLLSLGVRGIRLGPSLPAFLTPALLAKLGEAFDLKATGTAAADLDAALRPAA